MVSRILFTLYLRCHFPSLILLMCSWPEYMNVLGACLYLASSTLYDTADNVSDVTPQQTHTARCVAQSLIVSLTINRCLSIYCLRSNP